MGYAIALLVFILLGWVYIVLHWMGKTARSDATVERMNPYGLSFSHAMTRAAPIVVVIFTLCGGGRVIIGFTGVEPGTGLLSDLLYIPLALCFLLFPLLISVVCFNWPKWVVAPRFRHETGMTVAWWRRRKSKRVRNQSK